MHTKVLVNLYLIKYRLRGEPHEYVVQDTSATKARLRFLHMLPEAKIQSTECANYILRKRHIRNDRSVK